MWNRNTGSNKRIGFADVVVTGELYDEGADVPETAPAGWSVIPGTFNKIESATNGTDAGWTTSSKNIKYEDAKNQFGSITSGGWASINFFCDKAGAYEMVMPFRWDQANGQNDDIHFVITDQATGKVEIDQHFIFTGGRDDKTIPLEGVISKGRKTFKVTFTGVGNTSYITNIMAPTFNWVSEDYDASRIPSGYLAIPGTLTLSKNYWTENGLQIENETSETPNFGWASNGSSATARVYCAEEGFYSAKFDFYGFYSEGDMTLELKDEATQKVEATAVYHVAAQEVAEILLPGKVTVGKKSLKVSFSNVAGSFCANFYAPEMAIAELGEGTVVGLTVDGRQADAAVVEALNADGAAAISDMVFTAVPAVKATFDNGSAVEAAVKVENGTAVATFAHPVLAEKSFTLTIDGLHIYTAAANDKAVKIVYDAALNQADGSWSNGLYTIRDCNDGWGGTQFKFKPGTHTLEVPSNVIVKQVKFAKLFDNYGPGKVVSVTSEGAETFMPTVSDFVQGGAGAYDLVVNFENHQQGAPITFTLEGSQPVAWFELLVEEVRYEGEPTFKGGVHTATEAKNHAVVTLSFDRPMQDAVATYNGNEVKADGGKTTLKFSLWDLAWDAETVLTLPAGAAKDVDGNANTEAITYTVKVGAQPATVEPVKSVIYVTNVEELRAAVADVMASNKTAEAPRRVIILKDGDYDLGVSADNNAPLLHLNKAFNVSIIGESRDGVVVRGTVKGISYPVFSVRYSTNTYLENFTIKNEIGPDGGQAVALTGGVRDVMVNMLLLGYQDTYVSGDRGYALNCEIHGTVDFICGGGNHYFENCLFVTEREGSVVCAPNTSAAQKWGFVFQNCSIDGIAGYHLGRPWDNNPAAYYLNTTLLSLPAEEGWDKMGTLETRLYEFNSMDKDGNALDLSGRKNPSTSTNKYTPVLTAEQAAEFTVENVLGGDDSWLATEEIATEINAPEGVAYEKEGNYIYWYPVDGAAGYMIYNNGQYVGYASGDCDHFDLATNSGYKKVQARAAEDYSYTIRAIAPNGTMSDHSFAMTPGNPTGIEAPEADNAAVEVLYYNLQGQPVEEGYRGAVIKVSVAADGTRSASKILAD
ncbi:MAG: pectinesterase family protein [[Clostridium] fimetarium]|nr:pectinesterase family protein [Alistipes timonensis]MCM1405072.1 pectinesterase family protein [[Clostridium] fimetarium]